MSITGHDSRHWSVSDFFYLPDSFYFSCMKRYFLELSYLGTGYAGFQVQENAKTIQSEVEQAFQVFFRREVLLTGSSRTDTGVHAYQNFFHFDWEDVLEPTVLYHLNALLPPSIALKGLYAVPPEAHCRFGALSREYAYIIYTRKDPFYFGRGFYYPYRLNRDLLSDTAEIIKRQRDFAAFSKKRGQNKTTLCELTQSQWEFSGNTMIYRVVGNRFLRGMVRGLVATQLQVARGKISLDDFQSIVNSGDQQEADFSVPGEGLFLCRVSYPSHFGIDSGQKWGAKPGESGI